MKSFLASVVFTFVAFSAAGASGQQAVTFPSGDSTAQGVLYLPQGARPHPVLVVDRFFADKLGR